jgi:myo-inositol-1(or 4)-monophosphatase
LVHEAGGVLTTFEGQKLRYNRADTAHGALVAAGRERHARLVELIRGSRAEGA